MFKNKNVLVYGLKKSGTSSCKLLLKNKANVYIYDDNLEVCKNFYENIFNRNARMWKI